MKVELPPAGMDRVKLTEALLGRISAKVSRVQVNARPVELRRERREKVERCMVARPLHSCQKRLDGTGNRRGEKDWVGGRRKADREAGSFFHRLLKLP